MDIQELKKRVELRKRFHEFIYGFHRETINVISQKRIRSKRDSRALTYAVRSAGRVLELIERDKQELRELGI